MRNRLFAIFLVLTAVFCTNSADAQDYTVSGRVIDFDTREPLKNVSVMVRKSSTGTVTNDSGYFQLKVNTYEFYLVFSFIGYANSLKWVKLLENDKPFVVELKKKANEQLDEVVVNAYKEGSKLRTTDMNIVKINPEQLKRAPLLFGEADIIKALILQPGVTNTGEGAGGYNVRGGNADQNLVLIDGAPLFNTSHLLGFYTAVTPDAVQDVTLHKGGMPAAYGGRLSSLLNMKIKPGNNRRMQFSGGVGPMSARVFINGPLIKNKLSFTGGVRAAYPDPILNQLKGQFGASRAFFYDAILKTELTINPRNKLGITGYRSYDRFKFDTSNSYTWESNLATLNYSSELNSKISFKLNANFSQFISGINSLERFKESTISSSIAQTQVKPTLIFKPNDRQSIELGLDYTIFKVAPGSRKPGSDSSSINALTIQEEKARQIAFFISDEISLSSKISLQIGLRYAQQDFLGSRKVYLYEPDLPLTKESITDTISFGEGERINRYNGFEPRLALKIDFSDEWAMKLSYNRGQQFLHLISNTTAISPVDFWKLSDNYIKQQIGDQYSAGVFSSIQNNKYEMSAEAYYRTTQNTVAYKDGALLLMNPFIETALLRQRGRAYGLELSAAKNAGKYTWQVNYTYSKSQSQVQTKFAEELINGGKYYPSEIDRPHNLSLIGKIKLGRGWTFSADFVFSSGRPATYPDGTYVYNGTFVTNYSKRNVDRLPAYHRLDAGFTWISKRFPEQVKYSLWNISFYNLYMRKNAYSIFFRREGNRLNAYRLSVIGGLIPSVTWNYNF